MKENRAEIRQKIENWFAKHSDEMIKDLGRLVEIKSVRSPAEEGAPYGPESRAVLALAQSMLEEKGFAVSNFEDIMISADLGPAPPLMGILAHLDIVEASDGWDTDPYKLTIVDGKMYGRGVIDNKGPSVAAMYAMYCARDLCSSFSHGCRVILGSGEETGFDDVTQYLKKNEPPPNVFSPDAEFPVVNVEKGRFAPVFGASWEKDTKLPRVISIIGGKTMNVVPNQAEAVIEGFSLSEAEAFCIEYSEKTGAKISVHADGDRLVVKAEGKATHASLPHLGLNAQTALIEVLAAMPFADSKGFGYVRALNRLFPHNDYNGRAIGIAMSDEVSGELTANFGVLRFSEYEFEGNVDSRTPACADEADITGITRASMEKEGVMLKSSTISHCHITPEDSPFVQTLLRLYEEYTGDTGKCLITGGQTYVHDIPGGVVFGCVMQDVNNNVHGANEFVDVDQLIMSAKMFTQAIIDMCC